MIHRNDVYNVIDRERNYQDTLPRRSSDKNTVAEYILMIEEYAAKARKAWNDVKGDEPALHEIRKIAALAVAAMENYGAPERA